MAAQGHAPFSMSSADRRALCPGSWRLEQGVAHKPSSAHADEGTAAHAVLEKCLRAGIRIAERTPGSDMADAVQVALDYVYGILDANPGAALYVEQRVEFPNEAAPGDVWGTLDVAVLSADESQLWVIDYKHGVGVIVDIINNRQLLGYAASFILGNENTVLPMTITLAIVQPRGFGADPIREWTIDLGTLIDWAWQLEQEIVACLAPDAPLNPGEKQCRFCGAKPTCPAIEARALAVAGSAFKSVKDIKAGLPPAREFSPERLAEILAAKGLIEEWLADVQAYAMEQAKNGVPVPGWKLVAGNSRRRFDGADDVIAAKLIEVSGGALSTDDVLPRSLVNLGTAERLLKTVFSATDPSLKPKVLAEKVNAEMAFLTVKEPSTTVSLVPDTDRRPAVAPIADTFGSVKLIQMERE